MTSPLIVQIMAERIVNNGINPKTGAIYTLDEITNVEYREAVFEYIRTNYPDYPLPPLV